jgi:uncharacterized protein (TIGR03083 family)
MIRDWIAAERRDLADVLDGLTAQQWDAPSLCAGWSVRHVVAHLTMPLRYSQPRFLLELVKAGGRFQQMSDAAARRDALLPMAQLIGALRDNAEHPWKPPGGGYAGALTHDLIHSLDITGPPLCGRAQDLALLLTGRRVPEGAFSGNGAGPGGENAGQ